MSEEETLALDAMRADNIIDLETRQQYEALNDTAMGDYMGTDDNGHEWCGICGGGPDSGDPCDLCEAQERAYKASLAADVVPTPTSGRQQAIAEAETPSERTKSIIEARHALLTAINYGLAICPDERSRGVFDAAYDALYVLEILNQK